MNQTVLVTGAQGCLGAWLVRALLERGDRPVVYDLETEPRRLLQVLEPGDLEGVVFVQGDVTDREGLRRALEEQEAGALVHLAGLQVPFCRADPPRGARVNVEGTLCVFEAASRAGLGRVVYASSAAVYGPDPGRPVREEDAGSPGTHYGVFKRANEENARIWWETEGLSSAGLRPLTVYGPGRDQGLTSGPTRALKAALLGRPFTIAFTGQTDFLHAADAAAGFLAALEAPAGARVYNLHGETRPVEDVVAWIEKALPEARGRVRCEGDPLPIAPELDGGRILEDLGWRATLSLEEGLRLTLERFRELRAAGRLATHDLEP